MSEHELELEEAVEELLADAIGSAMFTGWVVFATYIDPDTGAPSYYGATQPGQTAFTTLGMLEGAAAIERDRIVAHNDDQDDELDG